MPQFDVHKNTGPNRAVSPYVVIVQSRRFDRSRMRVVVPLVIESALPAVEPTLRPTFKIETTRVVLDPFQIVSVALDRLGKRVTSLKSDGDRIIAAIDLVISRAWD